MNKARKVKLGETPGEFRANSIPERKVRLIINAMQDKPKHTTKLIDDFRGTRLTSPQQVRFLAKLYEHPNGEYRRYPDRLVPISIATSTPKGLTVIKKLNDQGTNINYAAALISNEAEWGVDAIDKYGMALPFVYHNVADADVNDFKEVVDEHGTDAVHALFKLNKEENLRAAIAQIRLYGKNAIDILHKHDEPGLNALVKHGEKVVPIALNVDRPIVDVLTSLRSDQMDLLVKTREMLIEKYGEPKVNRTINMGIGSIPRVIELLARFPTTFFEAYNANPRAASFAFEKHGGTASLAVARAGLSALRHLDAGDRSAAMALAIHGPKALNIFNQKSPDKPYLTSQVSPRHWPDLFELFKKRLNPTEERVILEYGDLAVNALHLPERDQVAKLCDESITKHVPKQIVKDLLRKTIKIKSRQPTLKEWEERLQ